MKFMTMVKGHENAGPPPKELMDAIAKLGGESAKAGKLLEEMRILGIAPQQALAIGDGANDIPMMSEAGVSVAYRAKPAVREHATHALDHSGLDGVLHLFIE